MSSKGDPSRSMSSTNTYLLLVPTVAPSNIEQSKRQVVGNLVSSSDKSSHQFVELLDEESEKQNILKRKVPTNVEISRPNSEGHGSGGSVTQRTKTAHKAGLASKKSTAMAQQKMIGKTSTSICAPIESEVFSAVSSHSKNPGYVLTQEQRQLMNELELVKDFDVNLSGLGLERDLDSGAYNMSDVLNLPMFRQEDGLVTLSTEESLPPLQYMLHAPTSPAVKVHEESLTYLNQGQSYEIKLKRLHKLNNAMHDKLAKSILRVIFHDRRLQYSEKRQLDNWKCSRPGERIVNVDIPMSVHVLQPQHHPELLNQVEFVWDLDEEPSLYMKINCISTEFTTRKHGGEKGVPFRVHIDTHCLESDGSLGEHLHSASCQIKVFKPKGADRKQKTDKDKLEKLSAQDKLKYQTSYDSTLLTECSQILSDENGNKPRCIHHRASTGSTSLTSSSSSSSVPGLDMKRRSYPDSLSQVKATSPSPYGHSHSPSLTEEKQLYSGVTNDQSSKNILTFTATAAQTRQWLKNNQFSPLAKVFNEYTGADMLSLTYEDMEEICGAAEGNRLYNALKIKKVVPRLTLYVTTDRPKRDYSMPIYRAFYLENLTANELVRKCSSLFKLQGAAGPPVILGALYQPKNTRVHVLINDQFVTTMKDESCYSVEVMKNDRNEYQFILKE